MGTKDFVFKEEKHGAKKGKRQYLNKEMEHRVTESLNTLFRSKAKVPRKNIGEEQEVEAVVCEEALLLARFIRDETKNWKPRVVPLES